MRVVVAFISLLSQTTGFHLVPSQEPGNGAPNFLSVSEGKGCSFPMSFKMTEKPYDKKKSMEGISLDNTCC